MKIVFDKQLGKPAIPTSVCNKIKAELNAALRRKQHTINRGKKAKEKLLAAEEKKIAEEREREAASKKTPKKTPKQGKAKKGAGDSLPLYSPFKKADYDNFLEHSKKAAKSQQKRKGVIPDISKSSSSPPTKKAKK